MTKFSNRSYFKPTPKNFRKLGDALLAVGATITATAIANDAEILAYISLFITIIGKFLTNFFSDD